MKRMTFEEARRRIVREPVSHQQNMAFREAITQIPRGKIATYEQVAVACGYPMHCRQVARVLRRAGER